MHESIATYPADPARGWGRENRVGGWARGESGLARLRLPTFKNIGSEVQRTYGNNTVFNFLEKPKVKSPLYSERALISASSDLSQEAILTLRIRSERDCRPHLLESGRLRGGQPEGRHRSQPVSLHSVSSPLSTPSPLRTLTTRG